METYPSLRSSRSIILLVWPYGDR